MADAVTAQPWPKVGEVIPQAVENDPNGKPFIYPYGWQFGDLMKEGMGTLQYTIQQEIDAGRISLQEGKESFENSGETLNADTFHDKV